MQIIHNILSFLVITISLLGALIVIWGVVEAVTAFFGTKVAKATKDQIGESEGIRQRLGAHLLLGIEIFIAADIISSVASPSWDKVGILGAIVAIRTVLSYFLRMELKQGVR